jgi:16S rRNA (adenine1518-N6/adenine1519-N6)-dimethyltransferase
MIYNFDFRKSLGQNFLIDDNIVDNIANAIDYKENNMVIEIGPGAGWLSKKIIPLSKNTILYEIDTRLRDILNRELALYDNYELIFNDALKEDISSDISKYNFKKLYVVANIPYYITSPILKKLMFEVYPDKIIIMIQRISVKLYSLVRKGLYHHLLVWKRIKKIWKNIAIKDGMVESFYVGMMNSINFWMLNS